MMNEEITKFIFYLFTPLLAFLILKAGSNTFRYLFVVIKNIYLLKYMRDKYILNKHTPENLSYLKYVIKKEIKKHGNQCNLNHIDVSNITDMSQLFSNSQFNGDISKWNTSKVKNMSEMFFISHFNGDISNWNTSNVIDMNYMFFQSKFNSDISKWNLSNVIDMSYMFFGSVFNKNISIWKFDKAVIMDAMFAASHFNGDISNWDISKIINMCNMFSNSQFNGDISRWRPYSLKYSANMFYNSEAVIPWWYNENSTEIIKKLKIYDAVQSLENKLEIKTKRKKVKI